jgi:hypothetical protein
MESRKMATILAMIINKTDKNDARGIAEALRVGHSRECVHRSDDAVEIRSLLHHIRFVEDTLIKSGHFTLPGRKALVKSDVEYEVVLVDATESPVQRPKKSKNGITWARKKDTP